MILSRFQHPNWVIKKKDHYHQMCTGWSLEQMLEMMDLWSWSGYLNPLSLHRNDSVYWAIILVMKFNDRNWTEYKRYQNDLGVGKKSGLKPWQFYVERKAYNACHFASMKCSWDRHIWAHSCCGAHEVTEHSYEILCDCVSLQACVYMYV